MGGHVHEVAGVGHERAQCVGGGQRGLGRRRHLHQVDVEVQQAGVGHAARRGQGVVEHGLGFQRPRSVGGTPGGQVPQRPGGEVEQRVGVERGHVEVVGVRGVNLAHRLGVGERPAAEILGRLGGRIAMGDRLDQRSLDR
jgi:hypothetical protein